MKLRLGEVLRNWRLLKNTGLRPAAKEIGISYSTLSRLEHGDAPDAFSLVKILDWLFTEEKNADRS